jgi:hypothetical protein
MTDTTNEQYQNLIKLLLPVEIFEYFEIVQVISDNETVNVHLDERDIKPEKYEGTKLTSKGFHPSAMIQDYPLRNKAVFLHVRRRRWIVESTGEVISRDWQTVAEGTRFTKGFADFLKGIFGQLPHQ